MPVMIINRASKVTPQQYEAVRDRVGWQQDPPVGAISHAISFTETGAIEVNVWESKELYERYAASRLNPALQALGVVLDEVEILDAYNVAVGQPAHDHMLPLRSEPTRPPEGPIMALYRRRNIPTELYDRFRAAAPIDTVPQGALAHAYGRSDDDVITLDVWQDGRAMIDFIKGVVIPAVEAQGLDFYWPELIPLQTFLTTPAAKAHERPFAPAAALTPAE